MMLSRHCCTGKRLVQRYRGLASTSRMARIVKISYEDEVSVFIVSCIPFPPIVWYFVTFSQESIRRAAVEAARVLERGGVVALPTDTIYGIACSTQCTEAIQRIYSIKGRQAAKPLAICVGGALDVDRLNTLTSSFIMLSGLGWF